MYQYLKIPRLVLGNVWIRLSRYIYSDALYLRVYYLLFTGRFLSLKDPRSFNEKIQFLKLTNRGEVYTVLADKFRVREFIAEKIGVQYLIPLLGVWSNVDEIDLSLLPDQFVLKSNHDSQSVIICHSKADFSWPEARKKLKRSMANNYYYRGREYQYKDIKPLIIAEKLMVDESGYELKDYKFFCFHGQVKIIQVDFGRFTKHKRNLYNVEWELLDLEIQCPRDPTFVINKPEVLDEMIKLSETLSDGFSFVRIDFYLVNNQIYFGEVTFHHGGGIEKIRPASYDVLLGDYIKL